jgi:hypothetical protein
MLNIITILLCKYLKHKVWHFLCVNIKVVKQQKSVAKKIAKSPLLCVGDVNNALLRIIMLDKAVLKIGNH